MPSGLTFIHVSAPVAIWTHVYAYSRAGGDVKAIWTYVYACLSAGEHMDLHFCTFERPWPHGLTSLHIAAPAVIWTYVFAYGSVAGDLANADVAVVSVSCTLRSLRREKQTLPIYAELESCAHFAQRYLENTAKAECRRVRRSTAR
jgi:hypothetical protein